MSSRTALMGMLAITALAGCKSVSAERVAEKPLRSAVCFSPLGILNNFMANSNNFGCDSLYHARTTPVAPESSKRILYTEAQRLQMAREAAQRMFSLTDPAHKRIVDQAHLEVQGSIVRDLPHRRQVCAASTQYDHELGLFLPSIFHPQDVYLHIASEWSRRYSDAQIAELYRAAQAGGLSAVDRNLFTADDPNSGIARDQRPQAYELRFAMEKGYPPLYVNGQPVHSPVDDFTDRFAAKNPSQLKQGLTNAPCAQPVLPPEESAYRKRTQQIQESYDDHYRLQERLARNRAEGKAASSRQHYVPPMQDLPKFELTPRSITP